MNKQNQLLSIYNNQFVLIKIIFQAKYSPIFREFQEKQTHIFLDEFQELSVLSRSTLCIDCYYQALSTMWLHLFKAEMTSKLRHKRKLLKTKCFLLALIKFVAECFVSISTSLIPHSSQNNIYDLKMENNSCYKMGSILTQEVSLNKEVNYKWVTVFQK